MSGIKAPIQDILQKLATLQVVNLDAQTVNVYARIFNNQIRKGKSGDYAFPLPTAFIEVIAPSNYNRLLNGVSEADIIFRIHLCHWFTDAQDGTFEQDLAIFDLRDNVIALLSNYRPTGCGNLCLTAESQDYDHDDIYVYQIDFTTGFIDSKGSPFDIGRTDYQNSTPPTGLVDNISYVPALT